jgi:O-methyltransferase domain
VAGGTGSFLIAIMHRHPGLRGTLFELPAICAVACRRLAHDPESARIEVIEGDLQADPMPGAHDAVIAANIVHGLSEAHNLDLLRKVRSHVPPGARLLLVDLWMDASRTEPPAAPLMGGEFLIHTGEGQSYAEEDADEWLAQTGWHKLDRRPQAGPASVIIAEAA